MLMIKTDSVKKTNKHMNWYFTNRKTLKYVDVSLLVCFSLLSEGIICHFFLVFLFAVCFHYISLDLHKKPRAKCPKAFWEMRE